MRVPFAKAYVPNLALVVLSLFPGLIDNGAMPFMPVPQQAALFNEGAFAFGILLAAECVRRLNLRPLYLALLAVDVVVCLALAFASPLLFDVLYAVEGLMAGMFLIVALPPLFTNFSEQEFPISGGVLVPGLFGAIMAGPPVAGLLGTHAQLWLFLGNAIVIAVAFILAIFTVGSREPQAADTPIDWYAIVLTGASMALMFSGNGITLIAGIALLVAMLVVEYARKDSLVPLKTMLTALPVIGFIAAAAGNAVFVADQKLLAEFLTHVRGWTIAAAGIALWPESIMALIGGVAFAIAVQTRFLPRNIVVGLVFTLVGTLIFWVAVAARAPGEMLLIIAMLAFSLGSALTVTPGLFIAGLSVEAKLVARGIAAVELLRLAIGFMAAPAVEKTLQGAVDVAARLSAVLPGVAFVCACALIATIALLQRYYAHPERPNLRAYSKEGKPAFQSPQL